MINEASDSELRSAFNPFLNEIAARRFKKDKDLKGRTIVNTSPKDEDVDTCLVQLRALGLIRESQRARSVKDTSTYWTLTPYGDSVMTQLRAIRRDTSSNDTAEDAG